MDIPKGKFIKFIKYFSKENIFLNIKLIIKFGFVSTLLIKLIDSIFSKRMDITMTGARKKLK